jgi:arylsulfatase A-like enzyme
MVESMDDAVGTVMATLEKLNLLDNTIVIFTSDNGGNTYGSVDGTTPTSNDPLRAGKASLYEGGVRVPTVVSYPKLVPMNKRSDELIQSCDFYPTLLEMLQVKPEPGQIFDGQSIVPIFSGTSLSREALYSFFPKQFVLSTSDSPEKYGGISVTMDQWKLIRLSFEKENLNDGFRLYDLKNDLGENKDLSQANPERVQKMNQMIDQFLKETHAVTNIKNEKYDPTAKAPVAKKTHDE